MYSRVSNKRTQAYRKRSIRGRDFYFLFQIFLTKNSTFLGHISHKNFKNQNSKHFSLFYYNIYNVKAKKQRNKTFNFDFHIALLTVRPLLELQPLIERLR